MSTDLDQLNLLTSKAEAVDREIDASAAIDGEAADQGAEVLPPLRDELAGVLDLVAKAGSFVLPTFKDHFNHEANLQITDAMIELSELYKWDLRAVMIGKNSPVLLWIGLGYSLAIPSMGCMQDYKRLKAAAMAAKDGAAEVKAENTYTATDTANDQDLNQVVTGAQ